MADFSRLIGETITRIDRPDDETLVLHLQSGRTARLTTEGDCCSHSWIEGIDDTSALLGKIQEVEEMDNVQVDQEDEYGDLIQFYGLKITTDKGRCVIDYRNESNGYYGGYMDLQMKEPSSG